MPMPGARPKVTGSSTATPSVALRPGKALKRMPTTDPKARRPTMPGLSSMPTVLCQKSSNMLRA